MNTKLYIQNLKCGGCAKTITKKLTELENITGIKVDVDENSVSFNYFDVVDIHVVEEALKDSGYPVVGDDNSLGTKAKSFVSCAIGKMS